MVIFVALMLVMAAGLFVLSLRTPTGFGTFEARQPYADALRRSEAGAIELETGEEPATVKQLLQEAAREARARVRAYWVDDQQQVLIWQKVARR